MKKIVIAVIVLISISYKVQAQVHRALVVGIDHYTPNEAEKASLKDGKFFAPQDLDGCKNDAMSIKSLLEIRFGFNSTNIDTLYNKQASRQNILNQLNKLLQKSKKDDIVVFYYAGHGSRQKNSKSREYDKKDEAIVPADSWKNDVGYIRDKEQAVIYNAFIEKGVNLTVILDCCNSGSMSRGIVYESAKSRYTNPKDMDANDPSDPIAPEINSEEKFLMISASQDNEEAKEDIDEYNLYHGAFTLALLTVMQQQPADASVINIVAAARAILKANGYKQEPQIAASQKRQQMNLLGLEMGSLQGKILIPAQKVVETKVELAGGMAVGLRKNNQLRLLIDTSVVLKVDTVISVSRASATLLKGDPSKLKAGQLYEISNWVGDGLPLINIYIPKNPFNYQEVYTMASTINKLSERKNRVWLNNLDNFDPSATYWYKDGKLCVNKGGIIKNDVVLKNIENIEELNDGDTLYFNLPTPIELSNSLKNRLLQNSNIEVTENPANAHYILMGNIDSSGNPVFFLSKTNSNREDSLEAMPIETKRLTLLGNDKNNIETVVEGIYDFALRLARVRYWLNLTPPVVDEFPFKLAVYNNNGEELPSGTSLKIGEKASLHIVGTPLLSKYGAAINPCYIYAFVIDQSGRIQVLYPGNGQHNRFPVINDKLEIEKDIPLVKNFTASTPTGTDNFYLLASEDPIPNFVTLFSQDGVSRTRNISLTGPLDILLNAGAENRTRGINAETSTNWKLLRLGIKTQY